jgi:hypothetical protein
VIRRGGGTDERDLGMRELARDGLQGGVVSTLGIEYYRGGVSREACSSKGVNLKYSQACLRTPTGSFARPAAPSYT